MGAVNRIQPTGLFGDKKMETNPFNINFEIPALPKIPNQQDE